MNLGDLKAVLETGFDRSDLEHRYVSFINRSLRKLQQDQDWARTKTIIEVTIPQLEESVSLPADFKAMTQEQFPVMVRSQDNQTWLPCPLQSEEYCLRYQATTFYPPSQISQFMARAGVTVFTRRDLNGDTLRIGLPAAEDLKFRVSYFRFLPDLVEDKDDNFLTREYEDLVEHRILATAFASINDVEMTAAHETLFAKALRESAIDDSRRTSQGRPLRMGG
jgi:hypothetical protein